MTPALPALDALVTDRGDASGTGYFSAATGAYRRDLLALRRAVSPLAEVANRLMRFEYSHIQEDTRVYFRDVYDHVYVSSCYMEFVRKTLIRVFTCVELFFSKLAS